MPEESLQPPPSKGPQCHPTHKGGTRPKALAHPPACQSQSNPIEARGTRSHQPPHRWIHDEMGKIVHPHWWKELKPNGKVSMGPYLIRKGLSNEKPSNKPIGSWQHSGCPWPNVRLWGGGVPQPDSVGSTSKISYSPLMPPAQGISVP